MPNIHKNGAEVGAKIENKLENNNWKCDVAHCNAKTI